MSDLRDVTIEIAAEDLAELVVGACSGVAHYTGELANDLVDLSKFKVSVHQPYDSKANTREDQPVTVTLTRRENANFPEASDE